MSPLRTLSTRSQRLVIFLLGVGMTAVVVLLILALLSTAKDATEINERGESREGQVERNDETLAILKDCTEPGGRCYKRSLNQTAGAVADLSRVVLFTAACGAELPYGMSTNERIDSLTECVTRRLAKPRRPR